MKKLISLLVFMSLFLCGIALAGEIELKPQTVCPVMGGNINKALYVDYQEQRIYFCCSSCSEIFLKEPEKYMKKLADKKVLLESVQEK